MTAWFWERCRWNVLRTYGMSTIATERDYEARARCFVVIFFKPAERIACAENDLTRTGVEGLEELDDARHRICREQAEVDDHFEVVSKEKEAASLG